MPDDAAVEKVRMLQALGELHLRSQVSVQMSIDINVLLFEAEIWLGLYFGQEQRYSEFALCQYLTQITL